MGVCELLHAQDRTWHSARSLLALTLALAHAHKHTHTHTHEWGNLSQRGVAARASVKLLHVQDRIWQYARSLLAMCEIIARVVVGSGWGRRTTRSSLYRQIYIYIYRERERDKEMVIERGIGMEKYSEIMGEVYRDIEGF